MNIFIPHIHILPKNHIPPENSKTPHFFTVFST